MSNPTVIICSFLPLNEENKNLFNNLHHKLKEKNLDLLFLTSSEGYDNIEFPLIKIPFSLKGFNDFYGHSFFGENLTDEDYYLIERDIFWNNDSPSEYVNYLQGFYNCKSFYNHLIEKIKPAFVFVWGFYLPQMIIFKQALKEKNIPVYSLERGFFSGSLMIEDLIYSDLSNPEFLSFQPNDFSNYEKLREFYFNNQLSKYPENHDYDLEKLILAKKESGHKIITLLGSHDTPLFPREAKLSQELSQLFSSSLEAAISFSENLNCIEKYYFIIKPHPNDPSDFSFLENEDVIVTKRLFNRRLFELSDVLIAGNTTLQFDVLFYEKPLILYAKSGLKNSNAVYNIEDLNQLTNTLQKAVNKIDFPTKLSESKRIIENSLRSYIYFYTNEKLGKNLNELVSIIYNNVNKMNAGVDISIKILEFEKDLLIQKNISEYKKINNLIFAVLPKINIQHEIQLKSKVDALVDKLNRFYFSGEYSPLHQKLTKAEDLILNEKYNEAETILMSLIDNKYFKVLALNDLSYIQIQRGNYKQALELIFEVLKIDKSEEIALNNLNFLIDNNLIDKNYIRLKIQELTFPKLNLKKINSFEEFIEHEKLMRVEYQNRYNFELSLLPQNEVSFTYKGICINCSIQVDFYVDFWNAYHNEGRKIPNWRERLVCPSCSLNNRMRFTFHLIKELLNNSAPPKIYITEQTTYFYEFLRRIHSDLIGSEYLGNSIELGEMNQAGIRNEDFTQLTFDDKQFDMIISLEVLEHIPNYLKALSESYRVLKKDGKFLFSVPFIRNSKKNIVRATVDSDGKINHILPPEYHGDPLNRNDSCLCYYHFGWELLNELKSVGYSSAYALLGYSTEYGYLGGEQIIFVAEK